MEISLFTKALASAIFDTAFAGACGTLLAYLWLRPETQTQVKQTLRYSLMICSIAMVLSLPLQLWVLTATMLGTSTPAEVRGQLIDVLTTTHAGKLLIPDFILALLLFTLSLFQSLIRRNGGIYFGLTIFLLLAIFRCATGHAAGDGDFTLSEMNQLLHLASIAVWAGGVMVAGFLVLPSLLRFEGTEAISNFGQKLSLSSTIAVLLVALSGLYNAWRGLNASFHPLMHSQWGGRLAGKSLLVLIALTLGAMNRRSIKQPDTMSLTDAARLTARIRIEGLVMLAILTVTGWLANSPPPDSQF
jgi:copper resistance protein D